MGSPTAARLAYVDFIEERLSRKARHLRLHLPQPSTADQSERHHGLATANMSADKNMRDSHLLKLPLSNGPPEQDESRAAAATWNTKKFREEYDNTKSRLTDQKFNIRKS
jgi:hypothetical protein